VCPTSRYKSPIKRCHVGPIFIPTDLELERIDSKLLSVFAAIKGNHELEEKLSPPPKDFGPPDDPWSCRGATKVIEDH
jgi:hypothetical protein